jgi:hypothetical protein
MVNDPDPRLLRLVRELDAERIARRKAEADLGRLRGVVQRVCRERGITTDAATEHMEPRPEC